MRVLSILAGLAGRIAGWRHAPVLAGGLACLALTLIICWPGVSHVSSRLWGDQGDTLQTIWNGWWMGESLSRGSSPMHTHMLWYPDGISMWLHTFGPLNALLTAAGMAILPGFAGFNLVVLLHVWLAAFGGFLLCRAVLRRALEDERLPAVIGDRILWLGALAGGAAFAYTPYMWAHIQGHLHVISIGPVALFAHALVKTADGPGWRWPVIAGLWALAAALCGWYVLVDAAIIGVGVLIAAGWRARREGWRPVGRVALAGGIALLVCLPLLIAAMQAQDQLLNGKHDAVVFSADLESLVTPTANQWIGEPFRAGVRKFTGWWEASGYLGYAAVLLSLLGLVLVRARWLSALMLIGLAGVVLSLGPHPHLGGQVYRDVSLPYHWLASLFPVIDGLGCPMRFGLVMNLALCVGVAIGCAGLAGLLIRRKLPAPAATAAVLLMAGLVVIEYAPSGQVTSTVEVPEFMPELRSLDPGSAAIDLSDLYRQLYYQTIHEHPLVGGYTSRVPTRIERKLEQDPVLGPLYLISLGRRRPPLRLAARRVDPVVDFDWHLGSPAPQVAADFEATWTGQLLVPEDGAYTFILGSDDSALLSIDRQRLDNAGRHPYTEKRATLRLTQGAHPVRLTYRDFGAHARISLRWRSDRWPEQVIPREALRTPDDQPGLEGVYRHRTPVTRLSGRAARDHLLKRWGLRFVLAPEGRYTWLLETHLGLEPLASSKGVVLWRVPGQAPPDP